LLKRSSFSLQFLIASVTYVWALAYVPD